MIRLFERHIIRQIDELNGLWSFKKEGGNHSIKVPVPSCWEQYPDFENYRGVGIYQRSVKINESGENVRFEFKGISHTADIYFDDKKIAHHYNAFTPFSTTVLNVSKGCHTLKVVVDNSFNENSALHVPNDYYTYGGITRGVTMEIVPDIFIERIKFESESSQGEWISKINIVITNLINRAKEATINIELAGESFNEKKIIPGNCTETIHIEKKMTGINNWSNESPQLYMLNAKLAIDGKLSDDLIERVGFREINIRNNHVYLNGKKIFLLGFNRHEDNPQFGCAIPLQSMIKDFDLLMEMGANSVRTCHYPNDELFLDLCDERGILVWEENHARGLSIEKMMNKNFDKQCADCNEEMVLNHFNHPSIIIWGILNECASQEIEGRKKYEAQYSQIREMDATRPMTSATCQHFKDICLDLPDIVSFNMYTGWYQDMTVLERHEKEINWINKSGGSNKPIIVSEFGGGALYGFHDPIVRPKWSEERQVDIIKENFDIYLNDERLTGVYLWQFADNKVSDEWFAVRPRMYNNKGILDEYRRPKMAAQVVTERYKQYQKDHIEGE